MMSESGDSENRRDFFRVTDQAYFSLEPLDEQGPEAQPLDATRRAIPAFSLARQLMAELASLDKDFHRILASINDRETPLAPAVRILNRKLAVLSQSNLVTHCHLDERDIQQISLSQGGMAARTADDWPLGSAVRIQLILLPDYLVLSTNARVLTSDAALDGFVTRFEFQDMSAEDQDLLSRHILRVQQWQLRENR